MKRYKILLPLVALLFLFSCVDDESEYNPQEKENINVDNVTNEDKPDDEDEELPEGQLVPGFHTVKLQVTQPDGETVERRFKYYMPVSTNAGKPISLIFEFHGSYSFGKGSTPSNPLEGISISNPLAQHAIKENCVICYPAGEVVYSQDSSGYVNWQNSEKHLPFVDAMIDYFQGCAPTIDVNRIYSTGQSSGAIFSFVLAFERSEVIAAIAPRAGQMSLEGQSAMPVRAVPVRVFAGEKDTTVRHEAVLSNMTAWAERIGGYFVTDMKQDTFTIEEYAKVTARTWHGANADMEIYSLEGVKHDVNLSKCLPYMWDFMASHTLDGAVASLFVTTSLKEIEAQGGESFSFDINYTEGSTLEMTGAPEGWNTQLSGKTVTLTGPKDFYGNIDRNGEITFTVTKDGQTASATVKYKLEAPKDFFEVGDIYYNDNFEPIGVVFWVNKSNIREAKILNLQEVTTQGTFQTINFGNFGATFTAPDYDEGEENTAKHMEQNATLTTPLTASNSGLVWAATYSYKNITGWYLPALNELKAIDKNLALIDEKLEELKGEKLVHKAAADGYLSSTVTLSDGQKCFNMMNFFNHTTSTQIRENTSYYRARAVKKVTK